MIRYLKLYWMFVKQSFMQASAFRLNFWMLVITNIVFFGVQFIFMDVIFSNVSSLSGWTKYDMFFYLGTYNIIDSLWMFGPFFNLLTMSESINTGMMDMYITKPINSQFMVSLRKVEVSSILSIFAGIGMIVYALIMSGRTLSISRVALYAFTILNGLLIMYSIYFILSCLSFWFIKTEFVEQIHTILCYFSMRPAEIYKGFIRFVLFYILPYGLMITISAKSAIKEVTLKEYGVFLVISWGLFSLTGLMWKYSLRKYSSASS